MDGEYEILPRDEIEELRKEVKKIQKNPFGDTKESITLLDSMEKLTNSINKLLMLFEKTQKEIIDEYEKNKPAEALNDILDQNEKIAKGTLAVADLIKRQQQDIDQLKVALVKPVIKQEQEEILGEPSTFPLDNKIPDMKDPFAQQPLGGTPSLEKVPQQLHTSETFQEPIPKMNKKRRLFHKN